MAEHIKTLTHCIVLFAGAVMIYLVAFMQWTGREVQLRPFATAYESKNG